MNPNNHSWGTMQNNPSVGLGQRRARLLVVDDHPITRRGIAALINSEPDIQVCGEAEDAAQALALVVTTRPEMAVMDLTLKGSSGFGLIKSILMRRPDFRILVLSIHDENLFAERALQ